jgi:hypothetical protein
VIADGRARFGCSLEEFYHQPILVTHVARLGILIPPLADLDGAAPPAVARIDVDDGRARWIADCPDCLAAGRSRAEYVWLASPFLFCTACGNREVGGRWRRVDLPDDRATIERLLLARPDPETRWWTPGETVEQLQTENVMLQGGGG